jgi:hypothetical protein
MCLAGLLGRNTSDHVGAIRQSLLDMEGSLSTHKIQRIPCKLGSDQTRGDTLTHGFSSETLAEDLGILVY